MSNLTTKYSRILFEKRAEESTDKYKHSKLSYETITNDNGETRYLAPPDVSEVPLIEAYKSIGKDFNRDFNSTFEFPGRSSALLHALINAYTEGLISVPYSMARGPYSPKELYRIANDKNLHPKMIYAPGYRATKAQRMYFTGMKLAKDPEALKAFIKELKALNGKYEVEH